MSKVTNTEQAIEKALTLLAFAEYKNPDDVVIISKKLIAQIYILELYRMGYDRFAIAGEVGVEEKAVRMWLNADHCPTLEHLAKLERFYKKKARVKAWVR